MKHSGDRRRKKGRRPKAKIHGTGGTRGTGGTGTERETPRRLHQRVRTAKKRTSSSTRWLERHLNDPYVHRAQSDGYRSRAAYKLIELDAQFDLLQSPRAIVDLGTAPGGWSQAVRHYNSRARIAGIDLLPCDPIEGAEIVLMDFMADTAPDVLLKILGRKPDLIVSDMAANTIGHRQSDHLRTMELAQTATDFAIRNLLAGGAFVVKVFAGGADMHMLTRLKRNFSSVKHAKPPASRKGSSELYVVAQGFRGAAPKML